MAFGPHFVEAYAMRGLLMPKVKNRLVLPKSTSALVRTAKALKDGNKEGRTLTQLLEAVNKMPGKKVTSSTIRQSLSDLRNPDYCGMKTPLKIVKVGTKYSIVK